ncbi:MAG: hypothetical protein WC091_09700 [Sulfuricellaceae bacterium]
MRWILLWAAVILAAPASAEEYAFDAAEFEKKPFELGGYVELKQDQFQLNRNAAFYKLGYYRLDQRDTLERTTGALELTGKYTQGSATFNFRGHTDATQDNLASAQENRVYEAYASFKPDPGFTLDLGKKTLRWGKGYAWSPVGFVERPKDPNDPELSREGYTVAAADFIRNFDGPLKTLALTPLLLPVGADVNSDFGKPGHVNVAAKLYFLYRDTDIDLVYLGRGSRTPRFGMDFSRNLTSNLEIHGEWARITDAEQKVTNASGVTTTQQGNVTSSLLGMRYLTENDTTAILEYYRNGTGYTQSQMNDFYRFVDNGLSQFQTTAGDVLLQRALNLSQAGYGRPNPMRNYVYARISRKEPFDVLYFTPSVTAIMNLDDRSYSITPELLYTGITNLELRFRLYALNGDTQTEFGEKQNLRRMELFTRYYF